jgi:pyridoxamine 5'-phosphate oxidase
VYASNQSEPIDSRLALESRYDVARQIYGETIPRPPWWGGFRLLPDELEFWQGRPSRLHDRLRYQKDRDGAWRRDRLAP